MKALVDSISINASPSEIFATFKQVFSSSAEYKKWHKDHVSIEWINGIPFEQGTTLVAEEYLHGKLHRLKMQITKILDNQTMEYKFLFPISLICPKGSFEIISKNGTSQFVAKLYFRFSKLFQKFGLRYIHAVSEHMKEEGVRLKKLVESNNKSKGTISVL